jgi:hypothetical protein
MKKIVDKLGSFWMLSFVILTVLFVISVIIYGFDIQSSGGRKALTSQIKNEGKTNYYYRITDEFAFGVFADREAGDMDVHITTYTENYIPFCFFCGYYTGDPDDDRGFNQPYRMGDVVYSTWINFDSRDHAPDSTYSTYNLKTDEYGYVYSLDEIGPNADSDAYLVTREYISENYDEISYSSADDEDCMIAFGAVFFGYSILLVWGIFALLFRKSKP